jgi:hypothetical protein
MAPPKPKRPAPQRPAGAAASARRGSANPPELPFDDKDVTPLHEDDPRPQRVPQYPAPTARRPAERHAKPSSAADDEAAPTIFDNNEVSDPGFALVILDLKESGGRPDLGGDILRLARAHLTRATGIKLILSVAKLSRASELGSAPRALGPGEAVAIDEEDDPAAVARWFSSRGVRRYAYGNGIATIAREPDVRPSIERAVRNERAGGRLRLVYVWTLEDPDSMQEYLELGVDGILVNARGSGEGSTNGVHDLVELVRRSAIVVPAPREHDPF